MENDIRIRPPHKDIKILDKTETAISHIKDVAVKTKDIANEAKFQNDGTVQEYASDKMTHSTETIASGKVYQAGKTVKRTAKSIKTRREKTIEEQEIVQKSAGKNNDDRIRSLENNKNIIRTSADMEHLKIKTKKHHEIKGGNETIKTIEGSKHAVVKTSGSVMKQVENVRKLSAIATERARQAVKHTAKTIETITKKAVIIITSCIKAISAALSSMIAALGAGGSIAAFILVLVVLFGGVLCLVGGGNANAVLPVSAEVEAYEPLIRQYATQHGISEYVELIKAVMMQESGGRGLDPMQSSEGNFNTRYPRKPNGITDPEYSISCGVQELKVCLQVADVESPVYMENIKLCLQGYNFGNGYISWAKRNYGGYTNLNAAEFSDMMAQRLGWDSYGDKQYVPHVLRYYPFGRVPTGIGNQAIVQVALSQEGNVGGQPYWSWYGFDSRVEWCACFVAWCAQQCGYIDAGIIPKFSLCSDGVSWFAGRGQFQDGSYVPVSGDIIFFDWGGNGDVDHVGIVESVVNGTVYTIEGNSGDMCRKRSYSIGNDRIFGYGTPAY
ncbi:MAG: CHAP domain-containing protein [Lachnospiraceae bacterium]|nr:CHAP domain-containing protein [Lachnospiraceae bacterium]